MRAPGRLSGRQKPEVAESPAVKEFVGARELEFEFEIIFMDGRMQSCFLAAN